MGKADLHIHTMYSYDGTCSVPAILKQASHIAGLDVIAITDHDEIKGALEAEQLAASYGIQVVPGIEISTTEGHLLALYVRQKIPAGLSLIETVRKVGEIGGLCIAAHPTAKGFSTLSAESIKTAMSIPDVARVLVGIEVFNAGILHRRGNINAQALAQNLPMAPIGSSDSHVIWTVGSGRTIFIGKTASDLRRNLETRSTWVVIGKEISPVVLVLSFVRGYLLRKAGWIECNYGPEKPIFLGRYSTFLSSSVS